MFPWPMPRERDEAVCTAMGRCLEGILHPLARGRGGVDVAIGEGLDGLSKGHCVLRLGYSGIGDYAREELGLNASTAEKMIRFARKLRERPLLRAAVLAGEVCVRRAEAVMHVAGGDAEEYWVARARLDTVRRLKAMAKNPAEPDPEEDERWGRFFVELSRDARAALDRATGGTGKLPGANAPRQHRMEALFQQYIGAHAVPGDEDAPDPMPSAPADDCLEPAKEFLEKQNRQWASLYQLGSIAAPWTDPDAQRDPFLLHDELRRLMAKRACWDQAFGHAAMVFEHIEGWRFLGFASFAHYCEERLGMAERTVQQRARLERRLHQLPSLRRAMCQRRISYEKARLIARYADKASVDVWIDCATRMTCIGLRRSLEGAKEAQMCARRMLGMPMPLRVLELAEVAFRAARREAGRWIPPDECLRMIAEHFCAVWEPILEWKSTVQKKVLERDRGLCQVPGCSRIAAHVHHIMSAIPRFRSCSASAFASSPLLRYAPTGAGNVQTTSTYGGRTTPKCIAHQDSTTRTMGAAMKGGASLPFITTGAPKSKGSLMLKMAGTMPALPTRRSCLLRAKSSRRAKASVVTEPTCQTNQMKNSCVKTCGADCPALAAAMFSASAASQSGRTAASTEMP